jgi:hypothetical protein
VVVSPVIVRPVGPRVPTPASVPVVSPPVVPAAPPPPVEAVAPPPFTSAMPQPHEQIAHFDPVQPPPGVVEGPVRKERSKRSTIVVSVPPPAEDRDDGPVEAMGEIDTGSRRVKERAAEAQSASIVVESDADESAPESSAAEPPSEPASATPESPRQSELRLEDLPPAKALPGRGRATRRRRTTQR